MAFEFFNQNIVFAEFQSLLLDHLLADPVARPGKTPLVLIYDLSPERRNGYLKSQFVEFEYDFCKLSCHYTFDLSKASTVDAILFHLRGMKDFETIHRHIPKRRLDQPWVALTFETHLRSNNVYPLNKRLMNGFFNRTAMSRPDADAQAIHGFVVPKSKLNLLPQTWYAAPAILPQWNDTVHKTKKLAIAFISNCQDQSGRLKYIQEMQKYSSEIHIYGSCGTRKCDGSHYVEHRYNATDDHCYKMAAENYLFYLSFENAICHHYITEKIFNILYHPMVPIVLGGANYHDYLPRDSYINAAYFTPKDLVKYMKYLREFPKQYMKYQKWKHSYYPSVIGGLRSMCHLCTKLHQQDFYQYKVYENFYEWFVTDVNCNRTWKPL